MKYVVVDNTEWTYPDFDFTSYQSASQFISAFTPRNTTVCAQVLLRDLPNEKTPDIRFEGVNGDVMELYPIYVEGNANLKPEEYLPHFPERLAPFWEYDCIRPLGDTLTVMDGVAGLYVRFPISKNAEAGLLNGVVKIDEIEIPVEIEVADVTLPDDTSLKFINCYNFDKMVEYHKVERGTPTCEELDTAYLKMMRTMHQNMLYTPLPKVIDKGNNKYEFDFTELDKFLTKTEALGYQYYFLGDIAHRVSWQQSTLMVNGLEAMSYEGYRFMSQYLPTLQTYLEEKGVVDKFYIGIVDEPNEASATEFRALAGIVRKFAPKLRLLDALSLCSVYGGLDVWVSLNADYQKNQAAFEDFRNSGDELWYYVCCLPRQEGFINRFMDIPLLATRYLFWGNYKYNLAGYLHWAVNQYQPDQDPFVQNCPTHRNADSVGLLPPGDTHLIYPGSDGPWMSMRLEAHRESAEDYELLCALRKKDKALADEICDTCFTSFNEVDYDLKRFKSTRRKLVEALASNK